MVLAHVVKDRPQHRGKKPILRHLGETDVEETVLLENFFWINCWLAQVGLYRVHNVIEVLQVLLTRVLCRFGRHRRLDRLTKLEQFADANLLKTEEQVEALAHLFRIDGANNRSAAAAQLDRNQPPLLKNPQRFSKRAPTDTKKFGKFSFARQFVAFTELPLDDRFLYLEDDVLEGSGLLRAREEG